MSDNYLNPLARESTVETMRRIIEAAEHDRDVAWSMVKGRDAEIKRLRETLRIEIEGATAAQKEISRLRADVERHIAIRTVIAAIANLASIEDDRWEPEGDLGHDEQFVRRSSQEGERRE